MSDHKRWSIKPNSSAQDAVQDAIEFYMTEMLDDLAEVEIDEDFSEKVAKHVLETLALRGFTIVRVGGE